MGICIHCLFGLGIDQSTDCFDILQRTTLGTEERSGGLRKVLDNAVEVLGNLRFFITVFVILFALMFANLDVWWFTKFTWKMCWIFLPTWLIANIVWDRLMPKGSGDPKKAASKGRPFLFQRMHCSNWRFALFLLIMSGFWTSFNQIFYTMPEYIRDFVDTRPAIRAAEKIFGESDANDPNVGIASSIATINELEREEIIRVISELNTALSETADPATREEALEHASRTLLHSKVRIKPDRLQEHLQAVVVDAGAIAYRLIIEGRQINPEFIVNINAGAIVLFQVLISFMMGRFHRFTTMIVGMMIAAIGFIGLMIG